MVMAIAKSEEEENQNFLLEVMQRVLSKLEQPACQTLEEGQNIL